MNNVIGFETTCDDTGVAVLDSNGKILSNELNSQLRVHLRNGGIIPMLARDLHARQIDLVAGQAFRNSGLSSISQDISAIAVSNRPGMLHSIEVGINYARNLAKKYSKPLIPIHHMQAHALTPLLENRQIRFPFIALLMSGGHCIISFVKRVNEFHLVGKSRDDAPGDLLDKFARRIQLRNLGHPFDIISGGAAVEILARTGNRFKYFNQDSLIPHFKNTTCDFSFSGYRGAYEPYAPMIDDLWRSGNKQKLMTEIADLSASLQRIILIQTMRRLHRAIAFFKMYWVHQNQDALAQEHQQKHVGFDVHMSDIVSSDEKFVDLVISGGVAANSYLTENIRNLCKELFNSNMKVFSPGSHLANDNGAMVAWNGILQSRNHQENPTVGSLIDYSTGLDQVHAISEADIGLDITKHISHNNFKLSPLKHPELKIGN